MKDERRSFTDIFTGTKELQEVYTIIGWIAVNHATLEQNLDYFLWQLEVFEFAGRQAHCKKSESDIRALAKQLRLDPKRKPKRIEEKLKSITEYLTKKRVWRRLNEAGQASSFAQRWSLLCSEITDLTSRRNQVIHSAVSWFTGSPTVIFRQTGWTNDHPNSSLDPKNYLQLIDAIGGTSTRVMELTIELNYLLPFKGDLLVISSVVRL